jgi:hypothetical protein
MLAALAALTLTGCPFPNGLGLADDYTVSSLLANNAPSGRVINLKSSQGSVPVPFSGNKAAFFTINAQGKSTGTVQVAITPDGRALQAAGLPDDREAIAPAPGFETQLRSWEAPVRALRPARRYHAAQAVGYNVGDEEKFWVIADMDGSRSGEIQVTAQAAYVGEHCYVFVDKAFDADDARVQLMGKTFDSQIFPTDSRLFGNPVASGVNGDPKITLLVTPAVGNYGRDTTIGYFTVRDLFRPEDDPSLALLKHSNRRLMLYMSSYVVSRGQPADFLGTIAHEFEHLINASQRLFATGAKTTEDVWLDEGLAMYAMEANGYGLAGSGVVFSHVAAFQAQPERYSLTNWKINPDESAYGAVYLYTTYLVDRFGEGVLKKLVTSPSVGVANVQGVLGTFDTTFEQVFEDWTAANLFDHTGVTTDPRFNYHSINMLGTYSGRRLRGLSLDPVRVPNVGTMDIKPYSARYFYVPNAAAGAYNFALSSDASQRFGGWVIAP